MARRIEDLLLAWKALSGNGQQPGWQGIAISSAGPCALRAARRIPENQETLLIGFRASSLPRPDQLPAGRGFEVKIADMEGDDRRWLALTKRTEGSLELFTEMVRDVTETMDSVSHLDERFVQRTAMERIRSWQNFMGKGSQPLSPEAELGLVGEIHTMCHLIGRGMAVPSALLSWVGPYDEPQDFFIGSAALEVKATVSSGGFPARISSLEQLDDSIRSPLYLAAVRFRVSDSGWTLPQHVQRLVERIGIEVSQLGLLYSKLLSAGYVTSHADRYTRRFEHVNTAVHQVTETFPRLIAGSVPSQIRSAHYVVELSGIEAFDLTLDDVLATAGVISDAS